MDNDLDVKKEVNELTEELTDKISQKTLSELKPILEETRKRLTDLEEKGKEKQKAPDEEIIKYKSFGEFAQRVAYESQDGKGFNEEKKQWDFQMDIGVLGGLLVPDRYTTNILDASRFKPIVRPKAFVLPSPFPKDSLMHIPAIAQDQAGTISDMNLTWIDEGCLKPQTEMLFEDLEMKPFECAAYWVVTNKLLRNAPMIGAFLTRKIRTSCARGEDIAFFAGNGVTQPTGFIGCSSEILVNRIGAGVIAYGDVLALYNNTIPGEEGNYVWYASPSARAAIIGMVNVAGFNIFVNGDISKGIPNTLFGIPIVFTDRCAAYGAPYDLLLTNLDYYLILDGSPLELSFSTHYLFQYNKTAFRVSFSVDGMPWLQLPILLDDGVTTVSPFIALN